MPNTQEMVFARVLCESMENYKVLPHIVVQLQKDGVYFLPFQGIK